MTSFAYSSRSLDFSFVFDGFLFLTEPLLSDYQSLLLLLAKDYMLFLIFEKRRYEKLLNTSITIKK